MEKKHYEVLINAPVSTVFHRMLDKPTYEQWTAAFNPGSTFEGSWNKGDKILFVGTGEDGKKGGMVAEIADHIPNEFVSIRHKGLLEDGKEITEGPKVEGWAGAHENYRFVANGNQTTVKVDVDVNPQWMDYFDKTWPVALAKLKAVCEA